MHANDKSDSEESSGTVTESDEEEDEVAQGAPLQIQKTSPVTAVTVNPVGVSAASPTYPVKVSKAPPADKPPKQVTSQTDALHPLAKPVSAASQKQNTDTARKDNSWDSSR